MILSFHPCFSAGAQLILGDRRLGSNDFSLIKGAEAIILPQTCSRPLYRACKASSAFLFPNYDRRFQYPGKTGQSRLFEKMHWPHPPTRRWRTARALMASPMQKMPFFVKVDSSHEGLGVWLIKRICDASCIDLAAMDFVFSMAEPDPQPLILEINYFFGRRGLGGSLKYYRMLHKAIRQRLGEHGIDPKPVKLV